MQRIGPGQFEVSPKEPISVEITKSVGEWLVSVSDLDNATWAPEPGDGTVGRFQSPDKDSEEASFTALFNFTPGGDSAGDFYTVTISGSTGDPNRTFVDAPALQHRTYTFEVKS